MLGAVLANRGRPEDAVCAYRWALKSVSKTDCNSDALCSIKSLSSALILGGVLPLVLSWQPHYPRALINLAMAELKRRGLSRLRHQRLCRI